MRRSLVVGSAVTSALLLCASSATADSRDSVSESGVSAVASAAPAGPLQTHSPLGLRRPTRWIAVSVATLWVEPGIARPVDRPAISKPAYPRRWVHRMSLDQKRWLFGRLETQALYGTRVKVLATDGAWSKVAVPSQATPRLAAGYPGWVPTVQLTARAPASSTRVAWVRSRTAPLWRNVDSVGQSDGLVMRASYNTILPVVRVRSDYVKVRMLSGKVRVFERDDVAVRRRARGSTASHRALLREGRRMLGLPYLWAGTSGFGYDCSGFTYSIHRALGIKIPRDASAQAEHGRSVSRANLRRGDLVFFQDSHGVVTHVGMYVGRRGGNRTIIESPGTGSRVKLTPLSADPRWRFAGARRYLARGG
jgi:cell wall-associated NlpC family hydrolase